MSYILKMNECFFNPIFETSIDIDNEEIIEYSNKLKNNSSIHFKNLNQGGYQFFTIENPPGSFIQLLSYIENSITDIKNYIGLDSKLSFRIKESWINVNTPFSYNMKHIHHRNFFSGVYYVKVPTGECGDIIFHRDNLVTHYLPPYIVENWNNLNSSTVCFKPKVGMLLVFPGWMEHSVTTNLTDQDRISVSFNLHYE